MRFLNGFKTVVGVVGSVATLLIAGEGRVGEIGRTAVEVASHLESVALGVFGALAALGIIHKGEKASARKAK